MKNVDLNLNELKLIRKGLAKEIELIDAIANEELFYQLSDLYDKISNLEDELED